MDEIVEVVLTKVALGGLHGGAGEETDHFVEEAIAGEGEEVAIVERLTTGMGDGADVVGVLGFITAVGSEGAEVVGSLKDSERLREIIWVELAGEVPGAMGEERRKDGREAKPVVVGL